MGFSISWIAVKGKQKSEVLAYLSLVDTRVPDEANESNISGAELAGGLTLLFLNDVAHPFISGDVLESLSSGCNIVACQVEEHCMASGSCMYTDGVRVWEVLHLSDEGKHHLIVEGKPPDILDHIRSEMKAAQDESGGKDADVDYFFEIPIMLAKFYTGYRHDEIAFLSGEEINFTELVQARNL